MLSLAERTSSELSRGKLKQVLIESDHGYVLIVHIGVKAVLAIVSKPSANLGMVFVEAKKTAKETAEAKVLRGAHRAITYDSGVLSAAAVFAQ